MPITIVHVDAFTIEVFKGNPAAVCIMVEEQPESWMQSVAAEMNLSDTAFLVVGMDDYSLRWFTPKCEVPLCGHATLATAHVMFEHDMVDDDELIRFRTISGVLTAQRVGSLIELDFPLLRVVDATLPSHILNAIGARPGYCGVTESDGVGESRYLLVLDSEEELRSLRPDFAALAGIAASVIVTARSNDNAYDFVSRYFAAHVGVNEDPVTGSAHCALLPYWSRILGRSELVGYQASERGGVVHCRLAGDRAKIAGEAVTVMRGELLVD